MYRIESIKVISLIFLCVAVVFPLTGCGNKASEETALKVAEKSAEKSLAEEGKDADVTINKDGDSVSMTVTEEGNQQTTMQLNVSDGDTTAVITGEDGNMTVASGASAGIPEGFPKDVPVHPSLKVNTSLTDGTTSFTLNASSAEKFDALVAYYKEESIKQGWKEQMSMQQNMETPMHMFAYEKDKRMMNIVIQQDSETINITINVTGE
jgi:hypothetical protein